MLCGDALNRLTPEATCDYLKEYDCDDAGNRRSLMRRRAADRKNGNWECNGFITTTGIVFADWRQSVLCPPIASLIAQVFNNLATTNLSLSLTEFGVQSYRRPTPQRAADILAETLRLCFGHEKMTTFITWGFWRPRMWSTAPAGALVDADRNITPAGMVWQQMTGVRDWHIANLPVWTTGVSLVTDAQGRVSFAGFYGDYEIISGGQRGEFTLTKGTTNCTAAVSRS